MSNATRAIPKSVTVCDLCDQIIDKHEDATDIASLTHGYIAHKVTEKTKRVWFVWPQRDKPGERYEERLENDKIRVEWDFHAKCLYDVLKMEIGKARKPS